MSIETLESELAITEPISANPETNIPDPLTQIELSPDCSDDEKRRELNSRIPVLYPLLLRRATRLTKNADLAGDVVQTAFEKAYANINQYQPVPTKPIDSWLMQITSNQAFDELKKAHRRLPHIPFEDSQYTPSDQALLDPATIYEQQEEIDLLYKATENLEPEQQDVVIGRLLGLSHEEIASELEIATGATIARLYRAKKNLSGILVKKQAP